MKKAHIRWHIYGCFGIGYKYIVHTAKALGEEFPKTQGVGVGLDTEMSAIRLAASECIGFWY